MLFVCKIYVSTNPAVFTVGLLTVTSTIADPSCIEGLCGKDGNLLVMAVARPPVRRTSLAPVPSQAFTR
jgi:hypothetical protein